MSSIYADAESSARWLAESAASGILNISYDKFDRRTGLDEINNEHTKGVERTKLVKAINGLGISGISVDESVVFFKLEVAKTSRHGEGLLEIKLLPEDMVAYYEQFQKKRESHDDYASRFLNLFAGNLTWVDSQGIEHKYIGKYKQLAIAMNAQPMALERKENVEEYLDDLSYCRRKLSKTPNRLRRAMTEFKLTQEKGRFAELTYQKEEKDE